MQNLEFLQKIQEVASTPQSWIFFSRDYPVLFFSFFIDRLQKNSGAQKVFVNLDNRDALNQMYPQLETSFLGEIRIYVLTGIGELSPSDKKKFYAYLKKYQGPHHVVVCVDDGDIFDQAITLPDAVTLSLYQILYELLHGAPCTDRSFMQRLFEEHKTIPLETACALLRYQVVLGRRHAAFFDEWLPSIVTPVQSLFTMSQYFFARQVTPFREIQNKLGQEYVDEFWVSYWSEQLWQAIIFITHAQKSSPLEAKKLVNRLPFSFMQKDWKSYTVIELTRAHDFLYDIDFGLKNGRAADGIELFYGKFLTGYFR